MVVSVCEGPHTVTHGTLINEIRASIESITFYLQLITIKESYLGFKYICSCFITRFTDLKQMCRGASLTLSYFQMEPTYGLTKMWTICVCHLVKCIVRWLHNTMVQRDFFLKGKQEKVIIVACCLFVILDQLQACLSHSFSLRPTIHCYVQCDTCCYFPASKRLSKSFTSCTQKGPWPQKRPPPLHSEDTQ